MRIWCRLAGSALAIMLALSLLGCEGEEPTAGERDIELALERVAEANELVELGDYGEANALYREAISLDPQNLDAHFGAAVTEALILEDDPEIADAIEAWIEYFDEHPGPWPSPGLLGDTGLPLSALALIRGIVESMTSTAQGPPTMSEMQQILENRVLPVTSYVLARFSLLESNPSFQFIATPGMTGEPESIEIDVGDIYLADAGVRVMRATIYFLISYALDVDDYEEPSWETLLADGSSFLMLYPAGWTYMQNARSDLLAAIGRAENGIDAILGETDDQSDDFVVIDHPEDPDFQQGQETLDDLRTALSGPIEIEIPWEQPGEPTVTVDLSMFFLNPIQDWKAKLPYYHFEEGEPVLEEPITFPDPTFNGMLPGMTNDRLRELFGW
jgi:tetratricopeptide (TPR) repeat protein